MVKKKNRMERKITNQKDSGILLQLSWSSISSADLSNADLLFRTINSANQLSVYRAVGKWCDELTQQIPGQHFSSMEKSVAKVNEQLRRKLEPEEVNTFVRTPGTNVQAARDQLRNHQERFEKLPTDMKVSQIC